MNLVDLALSYHYNIQNNLHNSLLGRVQELRLLSSMETLL